MSIYSNWASVLLSKLAGYAKAYLFSPWDSANSSCRILAIDHIFFWSYSISITSSSVFGSALGPANALLSLNMRLLSIF